MAKRSKKSIVKKNASALTDYAAILAGVVGVLESARRTSARSVNAIMTATYWEIGRLIVECEQGGHGRAEYGRQIVERLSQDLTARFGRGFGRRNLFQMRAFYLTYAKIVQTPSAQFRHVGRLDAALPPGAHSTAERESYLMALTKEFPLPWSHYVRLLCVEDSAARTFYESEALQNGWSVRQLDRQIETLFYERRVCARNQTVAVDKTVRQDPQEIVTPEEEIKSPFVLEFLGLKDEYSESELEDALVHQLENFLLELGRDFAFIGRQRRLRIGDQWYRVDLLFFHRRLRGLVVIDLKLGQFTHADAGQMHVYLNYAREHWTHPEENPPVGLILCTEKDEALARYALEGLPNKVLATEYRTALPDEATLAAEINRTRRRWEAHLETKRRSEEVS